MHRYAFNDIHIIRKDQADLGSFSFEGSSSRVSCYHCGVECWSDYLIYINRYGFLSENATFSERLSGEGIIFIGPPASAIVSMGSKRSAKIEFLFDMYVLS